MQRQTLALSLALPGMAPPVPQKGKWVLGSNVTKATAEGLGDLLICSLGNERQCPQAHTKASIGPGSACP